MTIGRRPAAGPALLALLGMAALSSASEAQAPPSPAITPPELVVILAPRAAKSDEVFALPELARRQGVAVRATSPVSASPSARAAFQGDAWVLDLEPGSDPDLAASLLARDPAVLYAGPNHLIPVTQIVPDDPLFISQYALASARVPEAWEVSDGGGILIAIIDTGVELDHPDLQHQIAVNTAEANGLPGVDDDGNGFVDDVRGYDFTDVPGYPGTGDYLDRDPDPTDDVGHGTQVAGVAAAEWQNGIGIAGVAPGARLLPVRAGFRTGIPFVSALLQEDDAAAAILYAADRGAKILNLSFGDVVDAPLIRHAVRYAQERGALVVASAGNTGRDEPFFPAAYPGVLVPGASTREGVRASFSTFGQDLDLLAPGLAVLTTDLGGGYRTSTGTSFSAPMTAGAAALVWSAHPGWSADEVAWALRLDAARTQSGWSPGVGWGLLDANAAVRDTVRPPVVQIESHPPDGIEAGVRGTVAAPDLLDWSLSVLPESSAVLGSMTGERALVQESTLQVVHDSLAAFSPPPGEEGFWAFRLTARLRDRGFLEERSRAFLPATAVTADNLVLELQAGKAGWSLAGGWSSGERHQGALRLSSPGVVDRFAMEADLGTHHGVRLVDPLPEGNQSVDVLARAGETLPFELLSRTTVRVPRAPATWNVVGAGNFPGGTPMPRAIDQDGNGSPEVFVEAPPAGNLYGFVHEFEVSAPGVASERGSSDSIYRGIPIDVADADRDGRLELVVFRLDAWEIWEASSPNGFPDRLVHQETDPSTHPVRFIPVPSGEGLLVAAGPNLRLLTPDGSNGFAVASEAARSGPALQPEAAIGDFDGDGLQDIAVADQEGGLALFELSGSTLRFDSALTGPVPFEPALVAIPGTNGRSDLVTVERDPPSPQVEGDLDRAATRLRRWIWDGTALRSTSTLAFAGMTPPGRIQLSNLGDELFLRRESAFDAVTAAGDSLSWGGRFHDAALSRVDGSVLALTPGGTAFWIGSAVDTTAEDIVLQGMPGVRSGSALEVMSAAPVPAGSGLEVLVGWEPDGCDASPSLQREGTVRGTSLLQVTGRSAVDTVALGESVTYRLSAAGCSTRLRQVQGRPIEPLVPRWVKGDIVLDLDVPLREGNLPEVLLRAGNRLEPPRAFHLYREGRQLLVAPGKEPPDSIVVIGAWQADGLPLGGSVRSAAAVPAYPGAASPAVLADVRYQAATVSLHVTLGGDSLACDATFLLLPENLSFPVTERSGSFAIHLPAPLASGLHTLELHAACLGAPDAASTRSFQVGRLLYPNPVKAGQTLVVEGIEPGSRIALFDVNGEERVSWRAEGIQATRKLDDLPPGLYLVRFEDPRGKVAGVERLAVIR